MTAQGMEFAETSPVIAQADTLVMIAVFCSALTIAVHKALAIMALATARASSEAQTAQSALVPVIAAMQVSARMECATAIQGMKAMTALVKYAQTAALAMELASP